MLGDDLLDLLGARVPADHARQTIAEHLIAAALAGAPQPADRGAARVLDLGCGNGDSVDVFRARTADVRWHGLDLPASPEVATRTRTDADFTTFDGVAIPFGDGSFQLVYCKQVLEHVRQIEPLLREVTRVLAPGGLFLGSTSQLEAFHSLSLSNPTPYGLTLAIEEAGLEVEQLRPGIDGLTLVAWRALGMPRRFGRWWPRDSPLNRAIMLGARLRRLDARQANAIKLLLCGQFCFVARKSAT